MGLFDSVYADCPTCGKPIEFQSKEGDPECASYTVETAPDYILRDVMNDPQYCRHCGEWSALYDPRFPIEQESPRPQPTMRKVRQPIAPDVHNSQPYIRWWNEPFSEQDFIDDETASA